MPLLKRTIGFSDMRVVADLHEGSSGGVMVGTPDWSGLRN